MAYSAITGDFAASHYVNAALMLFLIVVAVNIFFWKSKT